MSALSETVATSATRNVGGKKEEHCALEAICSFLLAGGFPGIFCMHYGYYTALQRSEAGRNLWKLKHRIGNFVACTIMTFQNTNTLPQSPEVRYTEISLHCACLLQSHRNSCSVQTKEKLFHNHLFIPST